MGALRTTQIRIIASSFVCLHGVRLPTLIGRSVPAVLASGAAQTLNQAASAALVRQMCAQRRPDRFEQARQKVSCSSHRAMPQVWQTAVATAPQCGWERLLEMTANSHQRSERMMRATGYQMLPVSGT
jgi:hypothetical protein